MKSQISHDFPSATVIFRSKIVSRNRSGAELRSLVPAARAQAHGRSTSAQGRSKSSRDMLGLPWAKDSLI